MNQIQKEGKHLRTLDGKINTRQLGNLSPALIGLVSGISEVGRSLVVERAQDNTVAASHVIGTSVRVVNPTVASNAVAQDDNALIEEGDNFGFDGTIS